MDADRSEGLPKPPAIEFLGRLSVEVPELEVSKLVGKVCGSAFSNPVAPAPGLIGKPSEPGSVLVRRVTGFLLLAPVVELIEGWPESLPDGPLGEREEESV